ncbi:MAG: carboxypeptidase regulatory-like domain-containing protein [Cyclobacteriaceae bacterium]
MIKLYKLSILIIISSLLLAAYGCELFEELKEDEPAPTRTMVGVITDSYTKEAIGGVLVELLENSQVINSTETNVRGSFTLGNIEHGTYTIRITKENYKNKQFDKVINQNTLFSRTEMVLLPYGHLEGRITAYESGEPIPGVIIRTTVSGSTTTSDIDGYYKTPQLEDGTYTFSFTKSGYSVANLDFAAEAGEPTTGDVQLRQFGGLKGRVSNYETNAPIGGVSIVISGSAFNGSAITDAEGLYAFDNLPEGNYTLTATISGFESKDKVVEVKPGTPRQENVQLSPTIPELIVSNTSIDFENFKINESIQIDNGGQGMLEWDIDESTDWLTVNPTSGTNTATELKTITVSVDRANLPPPGPHRASFVINSNGGAVTVTCIVYVKTSMSVYPEDLNFSTTSSREQFNIQNTGSSKLEYTISSDIDWLSVTPQSGTVQPGESDPVTARVDRSKLAPGSYQGSITINSTSGENTKVFVQLVVPNTSGPQLTVSASSLDFGTDIREQTVTIANTGKNTLEWNISSIPAWLNLNKNYGTLGSGQSVTVRASAIRANLAADEYNGRLHINSNGGEHFVDLRMIVEEKPILNVNADFLDFGPEDTKRTFTISNAGTGELTWELLANQDWLSMEPASGSGAAEIQAFVNRNNLATDNYTGIISIKSNAGEKTLQVSMQKTPPPPNLSVKSYEVVSDDNGTNEPNPGERVVYNVIIENSSGVGIARNVRTRFSSTSPYISEISPVTINYGDIPVKDQQAANVSVSFADNAPIRETFRIDVEMTDQYGQIWNDDFDLEVKPFHSVSEGLIAYYTFDDAKFTDKAGTFDLFDYGPEISTDIPNNTGYSVEFKAEEKDYLRAVKNITYNLSYASFNYWIKTEADGKSMYLYCASSRTDYVFRFFLHDDNKFYFDYSPYYFFTNLYSQQFDLYDGEWHMLTYVHGEDLISLYFDGIKIEEIGGWRMYRNDHAEGAIIGRRGPHDDHYFDGRMDNIRFYNRALTDAEVKKLYELRQ